MLRWVRLLISVLVVVAALAGGTGGAFAVKVGHSCAEMSMDDCPDSRCDEGSAFPSCAQFVCGQSQTTLPFYQTFLSPMVVTLVAPSLPRDDLLLGGLSGPPDLRPPIT
jgi:hypothetical protein